MTVPAHVPESPLETYTTSLDVAKWVLATVEGLGEDIVSLHDPLWLVAEHTAGRENPPVWLNALVAQLRNELLDLLHEAVAARGRPAVKSARSLFDLLVTARELSLDTSLRERYERHRWLVLRDASDFEAGLAASGQSRQEAHERRVRRREVRQQADAALADYGSGYRLSWTSSRLADRAAAHGLGDDYEWYRIASAILHGSAAGVLGHYLEFKNGQRVYRAGPAMGLAPDALALGLRWARQAFEALGEEVGGASSLLAQAIQTVEAHCPEFEAALNGYDRDLWESITPSNLRLVLVLVGSVLPKWYLRVGTSSYVRPAIEPTLSQEQKDSVAALIVDAERSSFDEPQTIEVELADRGVFPVPGSAWADRPQFFQQPSLRWSASRDPRGFDIRQV